MTAALKLIVENDKNELSVFEFDKNLITVGRSGKNDLVLDERNVSRYHFQLEVIDDRIIISDCRSYNHTFVDDRELFGEKLEIFVGNVITVGDYNIYLEQDEESQLKTVQPVSEVDERKVAQDNLLLAKNGYLGGKVFPLAGRETVIGSHASADVYISSGDIQPIHSKIVFDGNIYLLVKGDYKADYPLIVNDTEVDSVDMRNGDEIRVGDFIFEFVEKGEEYDPQPFQLEAEKSRKEKLRHDIKGKKIKSINDEEQDEKTEITRIDKPKKGKTIALILLAVLILAAAAGAVFFFVL